VLEVNALSVTYGTSLALSDVDVVVPDGSVVGVLGPNGAGKTTTIRMVTCYTTPTAGTLRVLGLPMLPAYHRRIKARLGIVQQEESLDPDLTVDKNLTVYASYFGIPRDVAARRAAELIRFAELEDHRGEAIRKLSGGMKRRLMLARALLNEPALLVLDEPTTGLDPQARRLVWERVRTLQRQGITILLTTHYMEEAAQLCDRIVIMDAGRIVAEGTPEALIAAHVGAEVIEVHLDDAPRAAAIAGDLARGPWRTERAGEVLHLHLRDGQGRGDLLERLDGLDFTRRRATLEDVFLTLTGHRLRD
jgi:lipooligosaccharide transport system ATP-binding protein